MKADRQEDMREKIRNANLLDQMIDSIGEMESIRESVRGETKTEDGETIPGNMAESWTKINMIQAINKTRLSLVNKTLADLKHVEVEGGLNLKVVEIDRTGVYDDGETDPDE